MTKKIPEFYHNCELATSQAEDDIVKQYIEAGIFIDLRRYCRGLTMVSQDHPKTQFYIRSMKSIRREKSYHLLNYYWTIHPLSKFALYRRFVMFFVLFGFFCVLPFVLIIRTKERHNINDIEAVLQLIFISEIIMHCFTGYYDGDNIILKPKKILLKYLKTYLIWDLLSIGYFLAAEIGNLFGYEDLPYWKVLLALEFFKVVRYVYWIDSYNLMMEYFGVPKNISSSARFIVKMFITIIFGFTIQSYMHIFQEDRVKNMIFVDFYDLTLQLLGVAYGVKKKKILWNQINCILFLGIGFCFLIRAMCLFWQHLNKFFAAALVETSSVNKYEAYTTYMGVSPEIKDRIYNYLDFRYQNEFYRDNIIMDILSPELLMEVRRTVSRARLDKVKLFSKVPENLKIKLEERLVSDTYLPGDVIIKPGSKGNSLFFIVSGTVVVTKPSGEHICCLEDGANFGEIALILNQERTSKITSATPCELLVLKRADYESVLNPHPEVMKVLRCEAWQRLDTTSAGEEAGPVCHLFDPGRTMKRKKKLPHNGETSKSEDVKSEPKL